MDPKKLHPSLHTFLEPGGLFDVEPCDMDLQVGKLCMLLPSPGDGEIHREPHRIVGVQKDYRGQLCYRVQCTPTAYRRHFPTGADFGRVAPPSTVRIIPGS